MTFADRLAEFHESLDGDFVTAIEASRFVALMEAEHPAELSEWMRANAVQAAAIELGNRDRKERTRALRFASERAFAQSAERFQESGALPVLAVRFVVDESETRRTLAEMTREDCLFAAEGFARQSRRAAMTEAFLRECGKRAGRKTVGDAVDEATVERLWRNLAGESPAVLPIAA
jgi:hypothetical protein